MYFINPEIQILVLFITNCIIAGRFPKRASEGTILSLGLEFHRFWQRTPMQDMSAPVSNQANLELLVGGFFGPD